LHIAENAIHFPRNGPLAFLYIHDSRDRCSEAEKAFMIRFIQDFVKTRRAEIGIVSVLVRNVDDEFAEPANPIQAGEFGPDLSYVV